MSATDFTFNVLAYMDNIYWGTIGWLLVFITEIYFTIISRGLRFKTLYNFKRNIKELIKEGHDTQQVGINPFKLYFTSVGGMVGLGNVVGISVALFIGGPGSLFWTLIAAFGGMILKYCEIYLGVKYRVQNKHGGFDGGPMYYMQVAFKGKFLAYLIAFLICLYGIETYQFLILVDRIEHTFHFNRTVVIAGLLLITVYTALGGIKRLASICVILMPIFMVSYIVFATYVIAMNISLLPDFLLLCLKSAFSDQAAVGGFAGSSMILAAQFGVSKTVYSGDIGVGYDSIVQSETRIADPKKQAHLATYALFSDSFIGILTNLMLGVTNAWQTMTGLPPSDVVANVLSQCLPYSDLFMTILFFFAGFAAVIAYMAAGVKCASFIKPRYGRYVYLLYAVFALVFFCNFPQEKVIIFMSVLSSFLVLINIIGIIKLRKKIEF